MSFMPDEWGSFQFTTSADAKRAESMFNRLSSENDAIREALEALASGIFDHLKAGTVRCDICEAAYKSARALLTKHGR